MNNEFGKTIKEYRKMKGLTQEQLGEELHVSRSKISNIENGRRYLNFDDALEICKALDISLLTIANTEEITSGEIMSLARIYFSNKKISMSEKEKTFEEIYKLKIKFEAVIHQ